MDLKEWRAARRAELDLPSGLHVTVQRIELLDLIAQGSIPTPALAMVSDSIKQGTRVEVDLQSFAQYADLINAVVRAALISPPLSDVVDAEHMTLDEIPLNDRIAIFNWTMQGAKQIAPFSGEPGAGADAGRAGATLQPETVGDHRDY
jgi:hypothetical protein